MNPTCLQCDPSQQPNAPSRNSSATIIVRKVACYWSSWPVLQELLLGDTTNLENRAQGPMPSIHLFQRQPVELEEIEGIPTPEATGSLVPLALWPSMATPLLSH